jgi:hypothetical protein
VLWKIKAKLSQEVWEQQVAAVQYALLRGGCEGSREQQLQEGEGCSKRLRSCSTGTAAVACAAGGSGGVADGGGDLGWMPEQQQRQLMAALCVLVCRSKRRNELEGLLQTAYHQL